jgi:hypothetical protein
MDLKNNFKELEEDFYKRLNDFPTLLAIHQIDCLLTNIQAFRQTRKEFFRSNIDNMRPDLENFNNTVKSHIEYFKFFRRNSNKLILKRKQLKIQNIIDHIE